MSTSLKEAWLDAIGRCLLCCETTREMRLLPPQMKPHMAAPLLMGSAIWHLAVLAVLVQTRVELGAVQRMAAGAHRSLLAESSDRDAPESVTARLEEMRAELEETLGSRLTVVATEGSPSAGSVPDDDTASPLSDISREAVVANATKGGTAAAQAGATASTWADSTLHRHAQVLPQACARVADFQALTAAAMDACCPASG